ncbi:lambda-crystallin homolog isoform X5 [Lynx canadensis]|uniref:lambda-crystallin homolog isoform X5 n=1 Tax=Lynx canadensis TaxID=61383 RepID=UPI0011B0A0B6|nr:lambda-crystallin homolog isoform X5 [Lynx canadensis]
MASPAAGVVVIVGSGLIGRSWAMLFASGGFRVKLYDIEQQQVTNALENIRKEMTFLEQSGSLKGSLGAQDQLSLISGCLNIQEAVEGALHIQECVPENLELKKKIFAQLDQIIDDQVVLSSSTSCLLPSQLFAGLAHVQQCLVAHPEGIVSPSDLDLVMSDGLGMRYAFIGPLETMHLNAEGHVSEGSRGSGAFSCQTAVEGRMSAETRQAEKADAVPVRAPCEATGLPYRESRSVESPAPNPTTRDQWGAGQSSWRPGAWPQPRG